MAEFQITCINKQPRNNPHEGITHLGGPAAGGWTRTREQIIKNIEAGEVYFTEVNGRRAYVGIVDGPNGKYLRTHADGYWNDNLLALNECAWPRAA
jgi:hypothetical protein